MKNVQLKWKNSIASTGKALWNAKISVAWSYTSLIDYYGFGCDQLSDLQSEWTVLYVSFGTVVTHIEELNARAHSHPPVRSFVRSIGSARSPGRSHTRTVAKIAHLGTPFIQHRHGLLLIKFKKKIVLPSFIYLFFVLNRRFSRSFVSMSFRHERISKHHLYKCMYNVPCAHAHAARSKTSFGIKCLP